MTEDMAVVERLPLIPLRGIGGGEKFIHSLAETPPGISTKSYSVGVCVVCGAGGLVVGVGWGWGGG